MRIYGTLANSNLDKNPEMGWVFAPAVLFDRGIKGMRREAFAVAVEDTFVQPLTVSLTDKLARKVEEDSSEFSEQDKQALDFLLSRVEGKQARPTPELYEFAVGSVGGRRERRAFNDSLKQIFEKAFGKSGYAVAPQDEEQEKKLKSYLESLFQ